MNAASIFVDNRELPLGKRIGKGGEGEVYLAANEAGVAIKLYTLKDTASREAKVLAMIRAGLAKKSPITAFPISLAKRRDGQFAGFTMRFVPDHLPLHELYPPGSRKQKFPHADFRFLVHAAACISRAIASVHHAGCVIGDINHSSILISKKATVALIDADSFQVSEGSQQFRCLVGVPEYTPPELQGKRLSEVVRTANHDAFGLAIVVFQMLFMGRHPFVGTVHRGEPPSLPEAIRDFRFAYSERRDVGMDRPPGTPVLSRFSPDVAEAFEKAFSREQAAARPSAMDWVRTLDALEKSLVQCAKNKLHFAPREATSCPWCEMEERMGTVLFVPYVAAATLITQPFDPGAGGFNVDAVWAKIVAVGDVAGLHTVVPRTAPASVSPSAELVGANRKSTGIYWARMAAVVLAAAVLFFNATWWPVWAPLALFAIFAQGGKTSRALDATPYLNRYVELEKRWQTETARWRARYAVDDVAALRASLETATREYKSLHTEEQRRVAYYQSVRKARQLHAFLDGFLIRNSKIKGIGPAKLAALASFGIESAADLTAEKLEEVPGIGTVKSGDLLAWRSKIERRFVYQEQPNDADRQELTRIRSEIQAKGAQLRKLLIPGAENLSRLASRIRTAAAVEDPALSRLNQELEQTKCDIQYLGQALPNVQQPAGVSIASTPKTPQPNASRSAHSHSPIPQAGPPPSCPLCGAGMVRRVAQRGFRAGSQFWGCSHFPSCRGTRN